VNKESLLKIENLKKYFSITEGFFQNVVGYIKAVDGINFDIQESEIVGLVGESGCGKTTVGRTILRGYEPTDGAMYFKLNDEFVDIARVDNETLKQVRKEIQMIFQDPQSSLNPRMPIKSIVGEPLICNNICKGKELEERVANLLERVGLKKQHLKRYPHAFSGGQRQRIGVARALAINPKLIIADEPVSALDVSIQAQVLNLLKRLKNEFNLAFLFISHDLSVIKHISDRVVVMYVGDIVEIATNKDLFEKTRHPYTKALLSAIPKKDPGSKRDRIILPGEVADPSKEYEGCKFAERCEYAQNKCKEEPPELKSTDGEGHYVACYFPLQE